MGDRRSLAKVLLNASVNGLESYCKTMFTFMPLVSVTLNRRASPGLQYFWPFPDSLVLVKEVHRIYALEVRKLRTRLAYH